MADRRAGKFRLGWVLLVAPYLAMMWVGSYARTAPALFGIPFFYWYQLLWIPLGAVLLYPLYRMDGGGK